MTSVPRLAWASLIAIIISSGVPCATSQSTTNQQAAPKPVWLQSKGIPRLAEVSPTLYRGAQPTDDGFAELKKMGVSIIVDMRTGLRKDEREKVTKLGMEYVSLPWHCPFPRDPVFAKFLKIIEDNPQKKVFVHCRLGDDRTGMAMAAYRMAEQGWSAEQAMNEMRAYGFGWAHHTFCPGLAGYEKSFPDRLKKETSFKDLRGPRVQSK